MRLDVSRGLRDLRSLYRPQVLVGTGWTGRWTLPRNRTRRRMACGTARRVGRVLPGLTRTPNSVDPLDVTFDQVEGNSEILRARCAEKRLSPSWPGSTN